jgi:putative transcriptional regulator
MDDKLFSDLLSSVKEGGKILRGKKRPSRTFERADDVRAVREQTKLSQTDFAALIGVNLKTLQNWEQGRRKPQGPARALLKIVAANPKSAVRALHA